MPRQEKNTVRRNNAIRHKKNPTRVAKAKESSIQDSKTAIQARWEAQGNITKGETKASIAKRHAKGDKAADKSLAKSKAKRAKNRSY